VIITDNNELARKILRGCYSFHVILTDNTDCVVYSVLNRIGYKNLAIEPPREASASIRALTNLSSINGGA
jgi:hypothetical protein